MHVSLKIGPGICIEMAARQYLELFRLAGLRIGPKREIRWGDDVVFGDGQEQRGRRDVRYVGDGDVFFQAFQSVSPVNTRTEPPPPLVPFFCLSLMKNEEVQLR